VRQAIRMRLRPLATNPTPMVVAVAAALALGGVAARADEMSDLKAQIQKLNDRMADLEAKKAAAATAPATPAAAVAPEMATDVSGSPISTAVNPVTLYTGGSSSLRMYGIVEATISRASNQNDGGSSATGFQVAWFSGNRLGFDMEHGLGLGDQIGLPGLKVISKLEAEFELPTGNMDTENVFFNRDAWMGFYSPDLGKITLGRQNTLTRDFTNNWGDPYGAAETNLKEGGYSNVNNFKQLIFYSGGPNGTRYNSAIEWKKFWGTNLVTGLAYKFGSGGAGGSGDVGNGGSLPGDFTNGTAEAASIAYNGINLGAAKLNVNANYDHGTVADLKHTSELVGGNVSFGPFRFNTGYIHYSAQQGAGNVGGNRTDKAWTTSFSVLLGKFEPALGYQQMKSTNAGLNGGGKVINPFGNMSGLTAASTYVDGAKDSLYGSLMYHEDKQLDLYVAADYFKTTGGYEVGDAQGNGEVYGAGHAHNGETELAVGVRYKF